MASEPKRPIEEMLEASAKARREAFGSNPKMPNPMRARLHDEIARLESEGPEVSRSWLQMFWPRIAVAAALATLLVIAPMMWWRGSNREFMQVADQRSVEKSQMPESAADEAFSKGPAAAAPAAPDVSLADGNRATLEPEQTPVSVDTVTPTSSELLADAAKADSAPGVTKGMIMKEANAEVQDTTTAAAAPPAAALAKARTDQSRSTTAAPGSQKDQLGASAAMTSPPTYRFSQQPVGQAFQNTVQRRQVANILNNFEVQQSGNEIRVVDSDGSTYVGELEKATPPASAAKRSYAARVEGSNTELIPARFRATGFNVSLRKSLVFEGNLSHTLAQEKAPNEENKGGRKPEEAARIYGTARVRGEPPVEVDARAVPVEKAER